MPLFKISYEKINIKIKDGKKKIIESVELEELNNFYTNICENKVLC